MMILWSIHEFDRLKKQIRDVIDLIVLELMDLYNLRELNIEHIEIEHEHDEKISVNIHAKALKDEEDETKDMRLTIIIKFLDHFGVFKFTADGDLGLISIDILSKFYKHPDILGFFLMKHYDFFRHTRELRLVSQDALFELFKLK